MISFFVRSHFYLYSGDFNPFLFKFKFFFGLQFSSETVQTENSSLATFVVELLM